MCKLASRVFFTVTTSKRRSKQVISIHWKRLVAFFVLMVIFNSFTEYGLRTKKFLSLFAKVGSLKRYEQQVHKYPSIQRTKLCLFAFSCYYTKITVEFGIKVL